MTTILDFCGKISPGSAKHIVVKSAQWCLKLMRQLLVAIIITRKRTVCKEIPKRLM